MSTIINKLMIDFGTHFSISFPYTKVVMRPSYDARIEHNNNRALSSSSILASKLITSEQTWLNLWICAIWSLPSGILKLYNCFFNHSLFVMFFSMYVFFSLCHNSFAIVSEHTSSKTWSVKHISMVLNTISSSSFQSSSLIFFDLPLSKTL